MGSCICPNGGSLDENTKMINARMSAESKSQYRTNKLLFLGPGGSGKSTIFKQLQWLHAGGFNRSDALMLREHIFCQITGQMKVAIDHFYAEQKCDDSKLSSSLTIVRNH